MNKGLIIGVDPDIDNNGIAIYQREKKRWNFMPFLSSSNLTY